MTRTTPVTPDLLDPGAAAPDPLAAALAVRRGGSARAGALMVVSNGVQLAIFMGSMVVLARLLVPRDFGLLAMASLATKFINTFRDSGLSMAALHSGKLNHAQASRLFWLNLRWTFLITAVMAVVGWPLAWFFNEPPLKGILPVLAIGVMVQGTANLHLALLRRAMRYGAVATAEGAATVGGVGVAIAAAWYGAGYWALVAQQVTSAALLCIMPVALCRWRPAMSRLTSRQDDAGVTYMVRYGRDISWSKLVTLAGRNFDFLLVGKLAGTGALGIYQNAFRWGMMPVTQVCVPLTTVMVGTFSRLAGGDVDLYRRQFRLGLLAVFALCLPSTLFLCVDAPAVIRLLLGDKWLEATFPLRALAIAAFFEAGRQSCKWIYLAEGRTRAHLRWSSVATLCLIAGVGIGAWSGHYFEVSVPNAVAIGFAATVALLAYPSSWYCLRGSSLRESDYWRAAARPAAGAILAVACVLVIHAMEVGPAPLDAATAAGRLALDAAVLTIVYGLTWLITPAGRRDLAGVTELIRSLARAGPDTIEQRDTSR